MGSALAGVLSVCLGPTRLAHGYQLEGTVRGAGGLPRAPLRSGADGQLPSGGLRALGPSVLA